MGSHSGLCSLPPADVIARLDASAAKHVVDADHCRMTWRAFGSGKPLVLLHGGHGSWLHWIRNIEVLATRFTVWAPDLPGFGESDLPAGQDLSSLVKVTVATMNKLLGPDTTTALAGFSFGGLVAANVSAARGNVDRLVLLGPAGHGSRRRPRGELVSWKQMVADKDAAGLRSAMRHNLAVHMLHDPMQIDDLAVEIHQSSCMRTRFRTKDISRGSGIADAITRQEAAVLGIWGEHDVTADPSEAIATLFSGKLARTGVSIPGAGHWVQYERPEEVNQLMVQWLHI